MIPSFFPAQCCSFLPLCTEWLHMARLISPSVGWNQSEGLSKTLAKKVHVPCRSLAQGVCSWRGLQPVWLQASHTASALWQNPLGFCHGLFQSASLRKTGLHGGETLPCAEWNHFGWHPFCSQRLAEKGLSQKWSQLALFSHPPGIRGSLQLSLPTFPLTFSGS